MARITVDDCLKRISNRFQLTLAATYRARQLSAGAELARAIGRGEREMEAVADPFEAIVDGNAGHGSPEVSVRAALFADDLR